MSGTAEVVVQAGHVHGDVVVSPGPEHLDIEVSCEPAEIEAMPNQLDLIYPWTDSERVRLTLLPTGTTGRSEPCYTLKLTNPPASN